MEDPSVVVLEGLAVWDDAVKEPLIEGERRNGGEEPTVACRWESEQAGGELVFMIAECVCAAWKQYWPHPALPDRCPSWWHRPR